MNNKHEIANGVIIFGEMQGAEIRKSYIGRVRLLWLVAMRLGSGLSGVYIICMC